MHLAHRVRLLHCSCLRSRQSEPINIYRTKTRIPKPSRSQKAGIKRPAKHSSSCSTTDSDVVTWNITITNHMKNGQCESALRVFNAMPRRSSVSWNAMISG
ncbi:hypothetical protein U1Q18_049891, partial [Sarracenia purpurea var. burkii]